MTAALPSSPLRLRPVLAFAALAGLVVAVEHAVVRLPAFALRPALAWAVLLDMLVLLPLLFYLLLMRRYRLSPFVLGAVVSACLGVACWVLPAPQWPAPALLTLLPIALECLTLLALATKGRALVRAYRAVAAHETRVLPRLQLAASETLGPVGVLLVAELDLLRFALLGWWERAAVPVGARAFSSHRESGFRALLVVACFGLLIESAAVHLLVQLWSPAAAGWLLVADAYALLFFIAHGQAVRLQPTLLTADELLVHTGFVWRVAVPRTALASAELLRGDLLPDAETLDLARPLLTAPNVLLTFAAPVSVLGLYGRRRPARRLAVYLDQPAEFVAALTSSDFLTR